MTNIVYNKINGLNLFLTFVCLSSILIGFLISLICGPILTAHYGHILCSENGALVKNEIRHKYLFISLPF